MTAELTVTRTSSEFERTPPQALEAEMSVLGGMLLSKDAIADVIEILRSTDFYRPAHQTIFDAIVDLYGKGDPADAVTVMAELTRQGELARIGGGPYLHSLVASVPTAASAGFYARIVRDAAVLRRLVEAGTRIVQLGYAGKGGDVDELVDRAQQAIFEVTERRTSEDYVSLSELLAPTLEEIEAIGARDGSMHGVPTGFADLDTLTNGLHGGQLVILAARPAIGKCVAFDAVVTNAITGERMTIGEFVRRGQLGETLAIQTLDESARVDVAIPSDFIDNGVRPVVRVSTSGGRSLRATPNHPLLTLDGWVAIEDLKVGDHIAVPPTTPGERRVEPGLVAVSAGLSKTGVLHHQELLPTDARWDEVVAIEPDGMAQVYDLTVDGTHNFVANDIVVHNSTLGLDLARAASIKHGLASVIFSLEMSKHEITMRLLSAEARVSLQNLRTGKMTDDDWTRLARRMGEVANAPLFIDDSPNLTMMEIRAKARRLKQRNELRLIVVDYMQLMSSPKRVENRQQEVSEISRSMKLLAKELDVPVVAISQLNRSPEQRADKKPQLSDLRESGCLTADTRVMRADTNAEVTFGELYASGETNIPVWTLNEDLQMVRGTMTHVFSSGIKETFELRLASGRKVKASANHPFLTYDGWKRLDELSKDTLIAVPRHVPAPVEPTVWHKSEVIMLAHLLGDGCFAPRQPLHYTSADAENIDAVADAAPHFGITPRLVRQKNWWHLYLPSPYRLTHGRRNPIVAWLDTMGLRGKRSYEKFIPQPVFALADEQVALFLRHLWATDGSVGVDGRRSRLYYATTSRQLADDVQRLLLRFGILSTISETHKPGYRTGFHVSVNGAVNQRTFLTEIGVHGERAEGAAKLLDHVASMTKQPYVDVVPAGVWDRVRAVSEARGVTMSEVARGSGAQRAVQLLARAPSRPRLAQVAEFLDDSWLRTLAESSVLWDRIVAIEPLGPQEVYDATVLETHNFIANGIVSENSLEQDADMVILLYREDAFEKESPRAGEADFIVAKHRNGPTATVTVAFQGHYSRFVDMTPS